MECLFNGDMQLDGEALSAYIHCMRDEEHLLCREGGKVFLENTFISSLLKRDGDPDVVLNYKEDPIDKRVENYLQADMVFIPINMEKFHWYLAVVNAKKCEIHVLDSMGLQIQDRKDLKIILKGLERQIKYVEQHKQLNRDKWQHLDVASRPWPIIEKITKQMQTDGVSCGLWMITFMEYWTGSSLSDNVTQNDITNFRFKLPAILWDSRLNTKKGYQQPEQTSEVIDSPSDVEIIDAPDELSKPPNASQQLQSDASPNVLSNTVRSTNIQELLYVLSNYIMSMDSNAEYLQKEWIRSTKPYPISLSLKKLKDILDVNKPMDPDCFNMAVRMLACNEAFLWCEDKYHYMDLQFCSISDFARDPRRRAKLDINQLAKLFECWPNMEYNISHCSNILLPYNILGHFTLFILNMGARSVCIMDPMPLPAWLKGKECIEDQIPGGPAEVRGK
ncbi:uncharacterized protein LOC120668464 isoform X1 [Panicum virgatum]|uniref:uncharacterized protein LOC120668464 isoform X1 n=1 Tax=Panicum virgatum TaxID=38727 RepID=UPI0019D51293|nr:uncharacterized protein LOC120668464 isoform X1 [Panicum virgatum]